MLDGAACYGYHFWKDCEGDGGCQDFAHVDHQQHHPRHTANMGYQYVYWITYQKQGSHSWMPSSGYFLDKMHKGKQ